MKAVHFGAGNIGRGFVGLILHDAGYEIVFADVNAELIDALAASESYRVHAVGENSSTRTVTGYRALNSGTDTDAVVAEIATADVVTTAVGPTILKFVAPVIAEALGRRDPELPPLTVMACENAINATDLLRAEVVGRLDGGEDAPELTRAVFANTAVDRIVPNQAPDAGLDVTVEDFFEWAIEEGPFGDAVPDIPDAHFVPDLAPYIERKLFTVNTGHATVAYHGWVEGASTLADALSIPEVFAEVKAVLEETKALLVVKHEFDPATQEAYLEKNLVRFANPYLTDTPERVGRQPLRKISRHERFIGPAAELAERGLPTDALLRAVRSALRFDAPSDPQTAELADRLSSLTPEAFATEVCGIEPEHPLFAALVGTIRSVDSYR
ncbi:mannitol-1-phosphate 5-dehydrogenase [Herbiconiux sp. KACC 21604]|uniref:mannitol-1-phosphate 5-dehydrogenase n=1 Tax=unclassified Herbiconiux TaxID=2618217 RepID=UPI001491A47D|nr:mannitol-1-phosphate 5-dehydrogenase [Herbiconiux sp. SALV-R1]QJU52422.1 mannitol-1-phosphate 5-dehydrogenase [Herbiconiux sp. SALV-R1]WPO87286.1 mannitol-1-phosphate 5-dehydrogenase [Herbiconiux sp. KACC 21604]